ncbi:hypothetical protein H6G27_26485 [Nostoc linckia FACHB-104]|nr:hypothetical protein [Nostoc linckia FACHB-104]
MTRGNNASLAGETTVFTSDSSLIEDPRLTISDTEVSFTTTTDDGEEEYSMPTSDYSNALEMEAFVNSKNG